MSSIMPEKHGSATSPQASDPERGEGWHGHQETARIPLVKWQFMQNIVLVGDVNKTN